jgi:hypothetical protein
VTDPTQVQKAAGQMWSSSPMSSNLAHWGGAQGCSLGPSTALLDSDPTLALSVWVMTIALPGWCSRWGSVVLGVSVAHTRWEFSEVALPLSQAFPLKSQWKPPWSHSFYIPHACGTSTMCYHWGLPLAPFSSCTEPHQSTFEPWLEQTQSTMLGCREQRPKTALVCDSMEKMLILFPKTIALS